MRSTSERHAYGEGKERENNGVVRCSSCGTNLIPLHFFLLSLLIANADAFARAPALSLSPSDISSSSRARPVLTYGEKSAYILTHTLGHASFHTYTGNDVKLWAAC